jgi:hypothetical protein
MEPLIIKYLAVIGALTAAIIAVSVAATREVDPTILHSDLDSNLLRAGAPNSAAKIEVAGHPHDAGSC